MKAKDKKEFLENWVLYTVQFGRLGQSTNKPEVWEEIKRLREDMRKLIYAVADECFDG